MVGDREPGISRDQRLGDEGLERLRRQLANGARPSELVLAQWVRRYGEAAQRLIDAHLDAGDAPGPDSPR